MDDEHGDAPGLDDETEEKRRETIEPLNIEELRMEPALGYIAQAVTELCHVPMAHVSIMEDETQCVVGQFGIERDHFARDQSFCAYTLAAREVTIVEDATQDERFKSNPYVTESPHIRFYVGMPLELQGIPVGTVCALDNKPGKLTERARASLAEIARLVEQFLIAKLVATSKDDHRYRLAAQLTAMCGLTAILDARLDDNSVLGDIVGGFKQCIEDSHKALRDWIEHEYDVTL